jgi:hypothetical protein
MSNVSGIERKIFTVERFRVVILHGDGRNARGDIQHLPKYRYTKAKPDRHTVSDWKRRRFYPNYPGYDVDVLHAPGRTAQPTQGNTLLRTVRDAYS